MATFNRRKLLKQTLSSVFSQDYPAKEYEVIIVVDGSTDGTVEMLLGLSPQCELKILQQANRGQAAALNAGLKLARGDLVLFLDDDIICNSSLLREHVAIHRELDPVIVFGPVYVSNESSLTLATDWTRERYSDYSRFLTPEMEPRWPYISTGDSNSSIPRSVLLACNGFDERFVGACDDTDLGLRLMKLGFCFRYQPTAVTHQIYMKSARDVVHKNAVRHGRNEITLCRTHPEFRAHSALSRIQEGPWWKALFRRVAMKLPFSTEPLLIAPYWMAERLRGFASIRRIGVRLLQARMGIVMFRSAVVAAGSWKSFRAEFGEKLPVLLYHHIGPRQSGPHTGLTISPKEFERQVRWLAHRGYKGIRPLDWLSWRNEGKLLPNKPVILTFDDGYADTADYALPILQRYGFGAAVFIVTRKLGQQTAWDGRYMMTAEQIKYWKDEGIEFGAHSRSHPDLTTLSSSELKEEVIGSREDLAKILGYQVKSFAYPYGSFNPVVRDLVQNEYELAFSCEEGLNDIRTDSHLLRRTMVQLGDSLLDIECRVRIGYSPIMLLRARLRIRSRMKRAMQLLSLAPS